MDERISRDSVDSADSNIPLCSSIPTIQSTVHVQPSSIKLFENTLEFSVSALVNSDITCKFFVFEDGLGLIKDKRYNIPEQKFSIQPIFNQIFQITLNRVDHSYQYSSSLPIVIEALNPSLIEMTLIEIRGNTPKILQQRVIKNKMMYEIREIFNPPTEEMDEREKSCVICMNFLRNAIIEPCCHICICEKCANLMRTQINRKCPMCRQGNFYIEVTSFIKIKY
jgi:hypothetical protein